MGGAVVRSPVKSEHSPMLPRVCYNRALDVEAAAEGDAR